MHYYYYLAAPLLVESDFLDSGDDDNNAEDQDDYDFWQMDGDIIANPDPAVEQRQRLTAGEASLEHCPSDEISADHAQTTFSVCSTKTSQIVLGVARRIGCRTDPG